MVEAATARAQYEYMYFPGSDTRYEFKFPGSDTGMSTNGMSTSIFPGSDTGHFLEVLVLLGWCVVCHIRKGEMVTLKVGLPGLQISCVFSIICCNIIGNSYVCIQYAVKLFVIFFPYSLFHFGLLSSLLSLSLHLIFRL